MEPQQQVERLKQMNVTNTKFRYEAPVSQTPSNRNVLFLNTCFYLSLAVDERRIFKQQSQNSICYWISLYTTLYQPTPVALVGVHQSLRAQVLTNIPCLFEHTAEKTFSSCLPRGFLGCSLTEQGQILSHLQSSWTVKIPHFSRREKLETEQTVKTR